MKEGTIVLTAMYLCIGIYFLLRIMDVGGWDRAEELIMRSIFL